MSNNPEQDILNKLIELEMAMNEEEAKQELAALSNNTSFHGDVDQTQLARAGAETGVSPQAFEEKAMKADLFTFGGLGLISLTVFWLCTHIVISAGFGWGFMAGSGLPFGLFIVPITIGISMLFYNFRSRLGQFLTTGGIGLLLFMMLMQLRMYFVPVTLLELLLMLVPLCAGISLLLKGRYKRLAPNKDRSN